MLSHDHRPLRHTIMTNGAFTYILIPKNASSSINIALNELNWNKIDQDQGKKPRHHQAIKIDPTPASKYFAILRDPIERWISGITQLTYQSKQNRKYLYEDITTFINNPWHDQHQAPQHLFLKPWSNTTTFNITTFKFEHLHLFTEWLRDNGINLPKLTHTNSSLHPQPRKELNQYIQQSLTENHREFLSMYYKKDGELYNQAQ